MTTTISNWYIPPVKGMRVTLNPEHPNYESYNDRQAKGTKGTIINLNLREKHQQEWNPTQHLDNYIFEIQWDSGHVNDYNLEAIIPLWRELPEKVDQVEIVKLSDGSTLLRDADYPKNLAIAVIENALRVVTSDEQEDVTLNIGQLRGYIASNLAILEQKFLNNDFQDHETDMLNTLIDAKEFYEKTTVEEAEENEYQEIEDLLR